ncbi:alpha/beta hydrolase family protein [Curtobacterium sp. PhB172]|uniref:alpha/beta hydrolase n=1 Tax=unclassified Curtobacterium TaxID=257496 RepID=UPI000F46400C|nr:MULTISPECIES: alpha/beta hydrolase [unclassified Curtobacterium]ROQ16652.1 alpha/beta hydrolase family protein [Curtobacterium sp. PhB171]ROQ25272.1 alpha/beta hydrolase family protein [Curtobacterium sp. PhB170]ROS36723.1 alpha/beta hydrolase family protein [Curtobacterium sp. PhB131]ROS68574.1 alpha/beta hydrolase family protein [Curtobacterium sp. PhB172]ROS71400.1 alpha/beta hydrolase family protein [Curtobacterium sp. PhB141]
MGIEFDDDAARRLAVCATEVAQRLGGSAWSWRSAAEGALDDFHGAYATMFRQTRAMESEDRSRLARALEDLAEQLWVVQRQARQERERIADLAAWRTRETDRDAARVAGVGPWAPVLDIAGDVFDPKPSEAPGCPTPVSAAFRARHRHRQRTGGTDSGGRSGADPVGLRGFAAATRGLNRTAEQDMVRLRNAWSGFTSRCGWVPVDAETLPHGFERYVIENAEDASWAERIAAAFAAAGGAGTLANVVLDAAGTSALPAGLRELLDPTLTPAEVAAAWAALGFTAADVRALPLATKIEFANLDGLPAVTRDIASRAVLAVALRDPGRVYRLLGLAATPTAIDLDEFTEQVRALRDGLRDADDFAAALRSPTAAVAQLVGFGASNGALVAAISLGDLDRASNVSVNVSGAGTTLGSASEKVTAANFLLDTARRKAVDADSFAIVSWFGYRTPGFPEVPQQHRASDGGVNLAGFLDGIHDSRGGAPRSLTVLGHSYGSTTAAEALVQTRYRVDTLVTYGSAGVASDTAPPRLNVDRVYATTGSNDHIAGIGLIGGRKDPGTVAGVTTFSADDSAGTKGVTGHDMFPDDPDKVGYLTPGSTSQRAIASVIATGAPR